MPKELSVPRQTVPALGGFPALSSYKKVSRIKLMNRLRMLYGRICAVASLGPAGQGSNRSENKCISCKLLTSISAFQDAFRAMHLDLSIVQLYLKPLLIGELSPEEPSQEKNKNVSTASGSKGI